MTEFPFYIIVIIGFVAQIIDGAMGMAYGVTATTFLLGTGLPPALISSSVHISEVFTSFMSGVSHFSFGNVNKELFKKLILPGVIGGMLGAYVLVQIPGDVLKPFIALYLLGMGIYIIFKAYRHVSIPAGEFRQIKPLAFFGGFVDSIGGGGWGPIVTTTLVGKGHAPRFVIGSVNAAEFFVTVVQAGTFIILLKTINWHIVGGLLIGGMIAAPLSAYITKKLPLKLFMILVGTVILLTSLRTLYTIFL